MEYNFDETQSFDLLELDYDLKHQEKPRKHPQNPHIRIVSYVNGTIVEVLRFANVLCCVLIVEDPREIVKCQPQVYEPWYETSQYEHVYILVPIILYQYLHEFSLKNSGTSILQYVMTELRKISLVLQKPVNVENFHLNLHPAHLIYWNITVFCKIFVDIFLNNAFCYH